MPDIAKHDELRGAFVNLEEYAMPLIKLPGPNQARATVRRRRAGLTVLATAAVVIVIVSVATFAVTRNAGPEPGVTPTSPSPTSEPALPMRLLTDYMKPTPLDQAIVNLPDFHHTYCPVGPTQFRDRLWLGPGVPDVFEADAFILAVVDGDVTDDGRAERIALITCSAGTDPGAYAAQVVAYTDAGNLLGQVTRVSGGQTQIRGPEVVDGKVRVLYVSTPDGGHIEAVEWRTFTWNGNRFAPAGTTPVQLDQHQTRLTLTAELTRFSGGDDPHATLIVRVANGGDRALEALMITMYSGAPLTASLAGTTLNSLGRRGVADMGYQWSFTIAGMPPGAVVEGTFDVTTMKKVLIGPGTLSVGVDAVGVGGLPLPDASDPGVDLIVSR